MRIRSITVRVCAAEFDEDSVKEERTVFHAAPGNEYKDEHYEIIEEKVINYLDKKYPALDFRLIHIGPKQINAVAIGPREATTTQGTEATNEGRIG